MTDEARASWQRHFRRLAAPPLFWGVAAGCIVAGLLVQASLPLGHDLGWLYFASQKWISGAEVYGRDLIEWNPPANLYLLGPAVFLDASMGLSPAVALRVWLTGLTLSGLIVFAVGLRTLFGATSGFMRAGLLASAAFLVFVYVGDSFGQREHLVVSFMLGWIVLGAARGAGCHVGRGLAAAAGITCVTALCIKPQYAMVAIALELLLQFRRPGLAMLLRPELIVAVGLGSLYLASLWLVTPDYPGLILPFALDTYWVYQAKLVNVVELRDGLGLVAALIGWACVRARPSASLALRSLADALCVGALAFLVVAIVQRTGWRYHFLPYEVAVGLLLALCVLAWIAPERDEVRAARVHGLALGAAALSLTVVLLLLGPGPYAKVFRDGERWRGGETPGLVGQLTTALSQYAEDGTVFVVSPSLVSIFPAVNYAGVDWTSRFAGFYLPAAVARARRGDAEVPSRLTLDRADEIEAYVRNGVIEDFERRPPDLILIDTVRRRKVFAGVPFDFLAYLNEDPRFVDLWRDYQPIGRIGRFEAAVRRSR